MKVTGRLPDEEVRKAAEQVVRPARKDPTYEDRRNNIQKWWDWFWGSLTNEPRPKNAPEKVQAAVTPTPTPMPTQRAEIIRKGLESHKADTAVLDLAGRFADLQEQYNLPDPYLVPILTIMETGGGRWFYGYDRPTEEERKAMHEKFKNNPFNWGIVSNPDGLPGTMAEVAEKVYSGIAQRFPQYQDYMKSGKLEDLFKHYTPESDPRNPRVQELVRRYNEIREAFVKAEKGGE